MKIRYSRQTVILVGQVELLLTAHMKEYGQTGFFGHGPHREQAYMTGSMVLGTPARHHQRLGAHVNCGFSGLFSPIKVLQGHISGRQQSSVNRAEVGHHSIVGMSCTITKFKIIPLIKAEIAETESGKHQLTGDTNVINSCRTISPEKRSLGIVVFPQHDVFCCCRPKSFILLTFQSIVDCQSTADPHAQVGVSEKPLQQFFFKIGIQTIRHFHQVAVGIMDKASSYIAH